MPGRKLRQECGNQVLSDAVTESRPSWSNTTGSTVSHVRLVFALIVVAYFLDIIDASIVQVALPSIQREFIVSTADLQWVYGAYALIIAGLHMLMVRAGDVYGQKKIFMGGLIIFTIASFLGGLAPSLLALIVFRAVQGIGAAMTTVTAFAILIGLYPEGKGRNRAFGIITAILSGGFAAGAVAGGVLTGSFWWRSVMFIKPPIGLGAVLLCRKYLPKTSGWGPKLQFDVPGGFKGTAWTILFVYV